MTPKLRYVFAGILISDAVRSLRQDMWGKDRYVQLVQVGWVDSSITVPLAIGLLVVAVALMWGRD